MRQGILALFLLGLLGGCATGLTATTPATATTDTTTPTATIETTQVDISKVMAQADLSYQQGDLQAAEQAYRLAIQHSPDNAPAQYRLGNTLARQNRYDDAIRAYKASLAQDANQMQTYNNLATLYMYQAQAILASGVDHLPADDGNTAQIKHMLWQLKKITPETLRDTGSQAQNKMQQ
jgi:tetratricopeptide (TPR) repeat protein